MFTEITMTTATTMINRGGRMAGKRTRMMERWERRNRKRERERKWKKRGERREKGEAEKENMSRRGVLSMKLTRMITSILGL